MWSVPATTISILPPSRWCRSHPNAASEAVAAGRVLAHVIPQRVEPFDRAVLLLQLPAELGQIHGFGNDAVRQPIRAVAGRRVARIGRGVVGQVEDLDRSQRA